MGKTPKVSRMKALTTIFLVVSMSLTVLISLMPTAMAAGERIEGTITDGSNPLEDFTVYLWYDGIVGEPIENISDINGDYGFDLPGAGIYTVIFANETWSGQMVEVSIVDTQVLTLDFVAVPDTDNPMMSEFSATNVDGVSVNQPVTFNFTIDETYLFKFDVEMYMYVDQAEDTANATWIKTWRSHPLMSTPGTEVERIDLNDEGNDINTTGFEFDAMVMITPFWWAASTTSVASLTLIAKGFSQRMCTPCLMK